MPHQKINKKNQTFDVADVALDYLRRGWQPVPITVKQKAPRDRDWQNLAITEENVENFFACDDNIGLQLGSRSGGLTDIDIDCAEALPLADIFLPSTGAIFGRKSKPRSHRLYTSDLATSELKAAIQYREPPTLSANGQPSMLVELRIGGGGKAAQTLAPGSLHPSGEEVCWEIDSDGDPVSVSGSDLKNAVATLAAATLLVRHYPPAGARHDAMLVLGGLLARRGGISADAIKQFATAIALAANDEESVERGVSAAGAVELFQRGQPTPGLPRMRELWGPAVADTVATWLGLGDGGDEIERLARLDLLAYERERKGAAQKLGIDRIATLDKIVEARREQSRQTETDGFLAPVEPWPEPVSATQLLDELWEVFDRHVVLSAHAALACALWTLHAHAHNAAAHSPVLDISSPTKRCGKTQLLSVFDKLVPKPLSAANVTASGVFRAISLWAPTFLIDEVDTFLADKSDLRGVLNSGHVKSSAYVIRCIGDDFTPKQFSTWCPKIFAHIGRVDPTLEDRSIRVTLRRRLKTEEIKRIPQGDIYVDLRRKCARFAADNLTTLENAEPILPPELNDRAGDNWRPLFAIAEVCDCGKEARAAALKLSAVDEDETDAIVLLGDLADLFARERRQDPSLGAMPSQEIATALAALEERKWPEYRAGKPITPAQLAALLKPFKIFPRKVMDHGRRRQAQGYQFRQFDHTFARYLPERVAGGLPSPLSTDKSKA